MERLLSTEQDPRDLAAALAPKLEAALEGGRSVALIGGLGAGKTTFVRYLVQALGGDVQASSPTFVLCHEYPARNGLVIEHWDVYRLSGAPEELLSAPAPGVLRLIEWADKFPEVLSDCEFELAFELRGENLRRVLLRGW